MENWKSEYLKKLLPGATLLVVGFSGWDIDISALVSQHACASVVWLRRDENECHNDAWSIDAKAIYAAVVDGSRTFSRVQVNTHADLCHALSGLVPTPQACATIDDEVVRGRYAEVEHACTRDGPWLSVWARWMGLRAGFWELGDRIPRTEEVLLSLPRSLDVQSHRHFYASRYLTAASLQGAAASVSRSQGDDFGQYLYFRNNQAEFLNRGAHTGRALLSEAGTWLQIVVYCAKGGVLSTEARLETRNLFGTLFLLWPLPPVYLIASWSRPVIQRMLRALARLVLGADLDKHLLIIAFGYEVGSLRRKKAVELFEWLGQRARVINLYRVDSLQALKEHEARRDPGVLDTARRLADASLDWAQRVQDPWRIGRSGLVRLEIEEIIADGQESNGVEGDVIKAARAEAWTLITNCEVSVICVQLAKRMHGTGVARGVRGRRLRRIALCLLETS